MFSRSQVTENAKQYLLLHFTENSRWVPLHERGYYPPEAVSVTLSIYYVDL